MGKRELTDLERDLGSGPLAKPVLVRAVKELSESSREVFDLRYEGGKRVRLAGDFAVEFGWKPKETSRRILQMLEELNECIKAVLESDRKKGIYRTEISAEQLSKIGRAGVDPDGSVTYYE